MMKDDSHLVTVDILGSSFTIRCEDDPDYIRRLVDYFKKRIHETQNKVHLKNDLSTAVLAGIFVCDELFKLRYDPSSNKEDQEKALIRELTSNMIKELEQKLPDR